MKEVEKREQATSPFRESENASDKDNVVLLVSNTDLGDPRKMSTQQILTSLLNSNNTSSHDATKKITNHSR